MQHVYIKKIFGIVMFALGGVIGFSWFTFDPEIVSFNVALTYAMPLSSVAIMIQYVGDFFDMLFGWTVPFVVLGFFLLGMRLLFVHQVFVIRRLRVFLPVLMLLNLEGSRLCGREVTSFGVMLDNMLTNFVEAFAFIEPFLWLIHVVLSVLAAIGFFYVVGGAYLVGLLVKKLALARKPKDQPNVLKKSVRRTIKKEQKEEVAPLASVVPVEDKDATLPPLTLLADPPEEAVSPMSTTQIRETENKLLQSLQEFGVRGEILKVTVGPVVCVFEFIPAAGVKVSRITGVASDVARAMSATSVRVANIAGSNAIGIEVSHQCRKTVALKPLLQEAASQKQVFKIPLVLGKDIVAKSVVVDLATMPHLLVAGTTGSGKSVGLNAMILSLLFRFTPDQCRLLMIDPKVLELSIYDGIPHLLTGVVTRPKEAVRALKWLVQEMEDRYHTMSQVGVRNLESFNALVAACQKKGESLERRVQVGYDEETGKPVFENQSQEAEFLPYIVTIIDEMADLMLTAGKEIELLIQRLAQKARAAGIHVITATQRPSVDVITGTIKANFPARAVFQVSSKIDSRTSLGEQGAEQLLGRGDMLFMSGGGTIKRVHGPFVSDSDIQKTVNWLRCHVQAPPMHAVFVSEETPTDIDEGGGDDLYKKALQLVVSTQKASTSYIQRKLQVGYNRAALLMEALEKNGIVSEADHVGRRQVLKPKDSI